MVLNDAVRMVRRLIYSGQTHKDYDRTVELAKTYKTYITGDGIDKKLIQFVQREDAALFTQRLAITRTTTPAVASSIRQPFNKVTRNDRIRKNIKLENEARAATVAKMMANFYGDPKKKSRGLEYWLKTRFVEMQFIDPNSWAVAEWDQPENEAQVVNVRPFEVSAEMATNFFMVNDVVKWLFVKQAITYNILNPNESTVKTAANDPEEKEPQKADGFRFTLYDEDVSVVFEQVDEKYLSKIGYVLAGNETIVQVKKISYLQRTYAPNVGFVPAFRIGYKRDELTSGRTFVNPWHDALCFFEKSLKTVSELDLTMALHTFPQKLQYVQKCRGQAASEGIPRRACNAGIVQGTQSEICPVCKGNGYKLHTTAQDAILLPMPDSPADIINLEQILVYKSPPIELIQFQNTYTQQLEKQAHQAVFNSQVFVKASGPDSGGNASGAPIQTATEADFNMQSVYDALEPFTEKYSEMWKDWVIIFGVISGENVNQIDVSHDFPADYKLKTGDVLLAERKTATDSGAPAFLIETIDDDLAKIIYAGDDLGLTKYQTKRRYAPFSGKKEEEITVLLASEFVPDRAKILYCNFEQIFKELETDDPGFWTITNLDAQRQAVEDKVDEWETKIKEENPTPTFGNFKPGGSDSGGIPGDGTAGDGTNPGANQPTN